MRIRSDANIPKMSMKNESTEKVAETTMFTKKKPFFTLTGTQLSYIFPPSWGCVSSEQ